LSSKLRIAVTGLAATYPFGGVFWDYLQYPLGLSRLGHDVLYLEDTGQWCYDPIGLSFVEQGDANAAFLAREITALAPVLAERWFYRDATGATYGRAWPDVVEFCRSADLFLHISASCWMRDEYFAASRVAFVDSDPMYTQASVPGYVEGTLDDKDRARVDLMRAHDVFFTFGENVGAPDCHMPTALFNWLPTRQPIVLDCFRSDIVAVAARRWVLTTVASWEPTEGSRAVLGRTYGGKSLEFERFLDLPARSAIPLEIALAGLPPADRLLAAGWRLVDAYGVSRDPWTYRRYLAQSTGEWSVAKNAYTSSRSGWFSGRTACYLALGVPAIVQDTGFGVAIPTGEGVLSFDTLDGAVAAIEELASARERHARAARMIAEEYFDSDKVLSRLLETALGTQSKCDDRMERPGSGSVLRSA
jgi:hypothetical protein